MRRLPTFVVAIAGSFACAAGGAAIPAATPPARSVPLPRSTRPEPECEAVREQLKADPTLFAGRPAQVVAGWMPDTYRGRRPVSGSVSFIVLHTGVVDSSSIEFGGDVDSHFRRVARDVALKSEFIPAIHEGCLVPFRLTIELIA